jgi:hypothetical protein
MVQFPGKGEVGCPASVTAGVLQVGTGFGALPQQAPSADAKQALDPIHALARDGRVTSLRVALHRHQRAAEGVVARDEVATGSGADQWRVSGGRVWMKAVADMQRVGWVVKHLEAPLGFVRSVLCWIGRVLFGPPHFVR